MISIRAARVVALVLLLLPLALGAADLTCSDDCADTSCGDCVQCQVIGVQPATAGVGLPAVLVRATDDAPAVPTPVAPARDIEHVPLFA